LDHRVDGILKTTDLSVGFTRLNSTGKPPELPPSVINYA
jgi:hypothetical protein